MLNTNNNPFLSPILLDFIKVKDNHYKIHYSKFGGYFLSAMLKKFSPSHYTDEHLFIRASESSILKLIKEYNLTKREELTGAVPINDNGSIDYSKRRPLSLYYVDSVVIYLQIREQQGDLDFNDRILTARRNNDYCVTVILKRDVWDKYNNWFWTKKRALEAIFGRENVIIDRDGWEKEAFKYLEEELVKTGELSRQQRIVITSNHPFNQDDDIKLTKD